MSRDKMGGAGQVFLIAAEVMRRFIKPKRGEVVLVVADSETNAEIVDAIVASSHFYGAEPVVMTVAPSFVGERFMPEIVWKALGEADTYFSLARTALAGQNPEVANALYD